MSALEIGQQLVDLCRQGKNRDAIEKLYSADVVSVEACEMEGHEKQLNGREAVIGKNEWWTSNHEVHSGEVKGPFPHDEKFAVYFAYDVTAKCGPMEGKRMQMEEVGLFTTKGDKIVKEEFFYHMG